MILCLYKYLISNFATTYALTQVYISQYIKTLEDCVVRVVVVLVGRGHFKNNISSSSTHISERSAPYRKNNKKKKTESNKALRVHNYLTN